MPRWKRFLPESDGWAQRGRLKHLEKKKKFNPGHLGIRKQQKKNHKRKQNKKKKTCSTPEVNRDVWHFYELIQDTWIQLHKWMDGCREKGPRSHWEGRGEGVRGSDNGVVGSETDTTGELLQQARDGAGRAGRRGLETDCGAVGGQEDFPHCLQTGLALGGEGTPGEESQGGGV